MRVSEYIRLLHDIDEDEDEKCCTNSEIPRGFSTCSHIKWKVVVGGWKKTRTEATMNSEQVNNCFLRSCDGRWTCKFHFVCIMKEISVFVFLFSWNEMKCHQEVGGLWTFSVFHLSAAALVLCPVSLFYAAFIGFSCEQASWKVKSSGRMELELKLHFERWKLNSTDDNEDVIQCEVCLSYIKTGVS